MKTELMFCTDPNEIRIRLIPETEPEILLLELHRKAALALDTDSDDSLSVVMEAK